MQQAHNAPSASAPPEAEQESAAEEKARKPYQFLMISILREYLAMELSAPATFPIDAERVYDDFGELRSIAVTAAAG